MKQAELGASRTRRQADAPVDAKFASDKSSQCCFAHEWFNLNAMLSDEAS